MKKQLITAGIVAAAATTTGFVGVGIASAQTGESSTNPMSQLVDSIAKKFNLNKDEVQKVFDENQATREQERETATKEKVAKLVTDGKLTQEQADKINAKRAELTKQRAADRTSMQNLSDGERKTKMDEHRTALDTWLKENNISTEYGYLVMGGGRGHGGPGGPGGRDSEGRMDKSSSQTTTTVNN